MNGIGAAYGLLAGLLVGAGLGWAIGNVIHQTGLGLIIGCLLGFGAGLYGVYKSLNHTDEPPK